VHLLDYDGGLIDASCIAVIAALQHFRRPDVSIEGDNVTIYTMEERVPVPLSLLHYPICVTFSLFLEGEVVLIDATLQEEMLRDGELTIAINRYGEICQIAKLGGVAMEALTLLNCANVALVKAQEITQFISKKLEEDLKAKNPAGILAELSAENER
jgi:exosome complex component RRP45